MNERTGTISIQRSLQYVGLDMVAVGSLKNGYVITRQQYVKSLADTIPQIFPT